MPNFTEWVKAKLRDESENKNTLEDTVRMIVEKILADTRNTRRVTEVSTERVVEEKEKMSTDLPKTSNEEDEGIDYHQFGFDG
jgi:hypothetical protein